MSNKAFVIKDLNGDRFVLPKDKITGICVEDGVAVISSPAFGVSAKLTDIYVVDDFDVNVLMEVSRSVS